MEIVAIVPLDKRRSRVLTDEELTFVLYRGELRKYEVDRKSTRLNSSHA